MKRSPNGKHITSDREGFSDRSRSGSQRREGIATETEMSPTIAGGREGSFLAQCRFQGNAIERGITRSPKDGMRKTFCEPVGRRAKWYDNDCMLI